MNPNDELPEKMIQKKKAIYPIPRALDQYLVRFSRSCLLPIDYDDLLRHADAVALYDKGGVDTLWSTLTYNSYDQEEIHRALLEVYALLRSEGDATINRHLFVDRIDLCLYGNTKPFRIRIVNSLNDNFEYFYIKKADASRVFGLELEHILSPNRIAFLCYKDTLIEDHVLGIPGDMFARVYLGDLHLNRVRLAKEFVKFNERCVLRLLGDMHSSNFVIDVTLDIDANTYRIRPIDFDQQCYEPSIDVYRPHSYKENAPYVDLVATDLDANSIAQYQREERALIRKRMKAASARLNQLLAAVTDMALAPESHLEQLGRELAEYHGHKEFLGASSMAKLVQLSLSSLEQKA